MKKLIIIVMLVGVSLFLAACSGGSAGGEDVSVKLNDLAEEVKDARDEAIYRQEYVSRLSEDYEALAVFLFGTGELDKFTEVNEEDYSETIENAVALFVENEEVHQQALERAKEVYAGVQIDCNWAELRRIDPRTDDFETYEEYKAYMEQNLPVAPPATSAETGKPISNNQDNPAGYWDGPID